MLFLTGWGFAVFQIMAAASVVFIMTPLAGFICLLGWEGVRGRVLPLAKDVHFSGVVYTGSMRELEKNHLKESSALGLEKNPLKVT